MALKLGELEIEISSDTSGLKKAESEVKKTGKSMERTFSKVGAAVTAALSVEAARQVVLIADKMTRLEGTVRRLTRTTGDFNKVWSELTKVSNENGIAIEDSTALFQRFQASLQNLTDSNQDVIGFIDNLQKLGRIGGSSAEELSNALTQLSQGLSGGVIRAEEFNSVMEQAPEIMRSVANNVDGVNGNLGKLRQLMLDGGLTADVLFEALQKGAADTNKEFAELPRTIDMASAALSNNFAKAVAELDKQLGASENIAQFFDFLSGGLAEFAAGVSLKPLKEAQAELINIDTQLKRLNESSAKRVSLEKALAEAQSPQARAEIQKSLDEFANNQEKIASLEQRRVDLLSEIERLQAETGDKPTTSEAKAKPLKVEETEAKKTEIVKESAEERAKVEIEAIDEVALAYDRLAQNIGTQLGNALVNAQSWSDAMKAIFADVASQFITAGLTSAFGGSVGAGNIFAGAFGGTGGGRAMGGQTSGQLAHPINERGTPEILNQAGKQFLLPTGTGGTITPLAQNTGGGAPNISMINMGTPQQVDGVQVTEEGIQIMISDALDQFDKGLNAELARPNSRKGQGIQKAFRMQTNVGRS